MKRDAVSAAWSLTGKITTSRDS